jgi:hypothetical protein
MRGRKLRALRTDGASKSRMIEPSFFLNYPSKNQKNPLASTPTAITAGEANHPPQKSDPFGFLSLPFRHKKEVPFPETLTRSVTRLPGRNFFYFILFIQVSKDLL